MSSESLITTQKRKFEGDDKESPNETALDSLKSPVISNIDKSALAQHTDCSNIRRIPVRGEFDINRTFEVMNENILEQYYIYREDKCKLNGGRTVRCDEQPLDFSRKHVSPVKKDTFPQGLNKLEANTPIPSQGSQKNNANNSDLDGDSCDHQKSERANGTISHIQVFNANEPKNAVFNEEGKRHVFENFSKNYYEINEQKAANPSGYRDEFHSADKSMSFLPNGQHFQSESSQVAQLNAEGKKSTNFQHALNEGSHVSNGHLENGSDTSLEKNDRFKIKDILGHDNQSELSEAAYQPNNSVPQQRTSPQTSFNNFGKENNLPSASTSPSHSVNLSPESRSPVYSKLPSPFQRIPFEVADGFQDLNGMVPPISYQAYNPIANFLTHTSPREVLDYSRFCSYPLRPAQFNPMYSQPYPQVQRFGQDQQKQKKQRPFKSINPSTLMSHLPQIPSSTALNLGSSPLSTCNSPAVKYVECSGSAAPNSSPQRLSPDSPCIINGSSGNDSLSQDTNGDSGRKKIRRIPPEEKDERYLEKRRKNNLAAKKSRDERRKKEDMLAESCETLVQLKVQLETRNRILYDNLADKERRLDMVTAALITFREKCEGRTREMFEDYFRSYLP